ncbi:PilW family protein [Xylophilus sp. ASV27]|uniref:PilW family protein n=1 Tax=Xylophilus sp. ASV27 TaxID=2795129 RepID=UPI0018EBA392|nr:PilW family protein [Xylophilus sp. ASV27]
MNTLRPPRIPHPAAQARGFTLVELLVAMGLSVLMAMAAVAALTVARQGFTVVDASSQLRDNGRYAADTLNRLAVQAGFERVIFAVTEPKNEVGVTTNPPPSVQGVDNAYASATDPLNNYTTRTSGSTSYGSDILILRYQAEETFPGSGVNDRTMIDCMGKPAKGAWSPNDRYDRIDSVLYVSDSGGEPALMCNTTNVDGKPVPQPLVQGVEIFQVLYGVDGVTPNAAPSASLPAPIRPERFLRASQMVVAGDEAATNANWQRVRSIRIGMVLRGPVGSAQQRVAQTLYPFGSAAMSSSSDPGTVFNAPADGRLRQTVTFTIQLRNDQRL